MTDLTVPLEIAGTIVLIVAPIIVLSWLLAGSDGPSLADIFAIPAGPPLPRGVQEEEPVRYRVERLSRPGSRAGVTLGERRAEAGRPTPVRLDRAGRAAVESGPCS